MVSWILAEDTSLLGVKNSLLLTAKQQPQCYHFSCTSYLSPSSHRVRRGPGDTCTHSQLHYRRDPKHSLESQPTCFFNSSLPFCPPAFPPHHPDLRLYIKQMLSSIPPPPRYGPCVFECAAYFLCSPISDTPVILLGLHSGFSLSFLFAQFVNTIVFPAILCFGQCLSVYKVPEEILFIFCLLQNTHRQCIG